MDFPATEDNFPKFLYSKSINMHKPVTYSDLLHAVKILGISFIAYSYIIKLCKPWN